MSEAERALLETAAKYAHSPEQRAEAASKLGRNNKRRGASGERELCAILSDALGISVKRTLGQARDGGYDVDLRPFAIECKRRKRVANLYEWIEQASVGWYAPTPGAPHVLRKPVVMLRADGKDWLAVMPLKDWIAIAREEIAGQ